MMSIILTEGDYQRLVLYSSYLSASPPLFWTYNWCYIFYSSSLSMSTPLSIHILNACAHNVSLYTNISTSGFAPARPQCWAFRADFSFDRVSGYHNVSTCFFFIVTFRHFTGPMTMLWWSRELRLRRTIERASCLWKCWTRLARRQVTYSYIDMLSSKC